jgi:SAM-dependent methyltransferase
MLYGSIREKVVEYQERRFAAEGSSARGLDWKSEAAQDLLFRQLYDMGNLRTASILDVGCGLAHFHDFLERHGFAGRYTGIDLCPSLIAAAASRRPGLDLRVSNILEEPDLAGKFDYVVASGVFSARLDIPPEPFAAYAREMVARMYACCRIGCIVNFLTTQVDFRAQHLYYADPAQWLSWSAGLSRWQRLQQDTESYFFALGIYRTPNNYEHPDAVS